jgi:hypothetical protein
LDGVMVDPAEAADPAAVPGGIDLTAGRWSSRQVRGDLERFLVRDLLGPWAGEQEELVAGTVPSERYILGVLSPAGVPLDAEATDATAPDDGSGYGAAEVVAAAAAGSMAPASLGLSCSLPPGVDAVLVTASWARYEQGPSDTQFTEPGLPRLVWHRVTAGARVQLDVTADELVAVPDPDQPGVLIRGRCRPQSGCRVVDVALVNGQAEPADHKDAAKLFQVRLAVNRTRRRDGGVPATQRSVARRRRRPFTRGRPGGGRSGDALPAGAAVRGRAQRRRRGRPPGG